MKIDNVNVVKLVKYIITHSRISESGIEYSMDKVDYALDELCLYFPKYSYNSIQKTLLTISSSKENITYEMFEDLLRDNEDKKTIKSELYPYIFIIPIGITIEENTSIKLFKKKLDFITFNDIQKIVPNEILKIETIKKSIHRNENIYIPKTFIKINVSALSRSSAVLELWNIYQIIKALIELRKSWGTQYIIHNTLDARGKINMPDWIIIKDKKKFSIHHFKLSIQRPKQAIKLSPEDFNSIKNMINLIKKKSNEKLLDFVIYRSFLLYNDALEQNDFNYCFLAFWQILETISLAERNGGDTKVIVNRIIPLTEKILGDKIQLTQILNLFAKKRCDLVHSGIGSISNDNINKIKYICEIALEWIIDNKEQYRTVNTLFQYYSLRSTDKTTIDSIKSAIKILKRNT